MIVDDEPLARVGLRAMINEDPDFEIVGECSTGRGVVKAVQENEPDLLFLDVNMPEMDGFTALASLGTEKIPHVIFVTAFDHYALQAFEVYAIDYILKPFDRDRFERALRRAKQHIRREQQDNLNNKMLEMLEDLRGNSRFLDRIVVKNDGRVFFVKTDRLEWVEAEGNYIRLHVGKESYLLRETISNLERQLDPRKFLRIHRSAIVNIDTISEMQPLFHGDYRVLLRDGTQLTLSRNYRKESFGL
ncbi:MAG: LytTR family DNA-binding domain-containing protein [Blastocatellia bacterium]|nr:LytTR family DNA-binding domain-containing protein [Blastocatellia bacterium]